MDGHRDPDLTDVALAVVAAVFGTVVVLARFDPGLAGAPAGPLVVAQVVGVALAVWGRRRPRLAFGALVLLCTVVPIGPTVVAAFALGRWSRRSWPVTAAVVGGLTVMCLVWTLTDRDVGADRVITFVAVTLLAFLLGAALREGEQARIAQAARDALLREQLARDTRQGERDRLAREMHDVVAHRISLMVLDANRIEAGSAPDATVAAGQIRDTGRAALDDMREVLGRLRRADVDDGLARQSLAEVEVLVAGVRAVGQPVELRLAATSRQPPDLAERTAVRIVREALTNAARHAPGAATSVTIDDGPTTMVVEVLNDAPEQPPAVALTTGGHGLTGMRERVEMIGGEWSDGPTPAGGFRVRAVLPRERR